MNRSEDVIQAAAVQWLQREGFLFFAVPNHKSYWRPELGHRPGVPDLVVLRDGCAYFIEFKSEQGRLSPAQTWWAAQLRERGFAVKTCKTLEEVKEWLSKK